MMPSSKASSHLKKPRSSSRAKPSSVWAWEQPRLCVCSVYTTAWSVTPLLSTERSLLSMTTIFSQHLPSAQQEEHPSGCSASPALPDLSTLSTLWVPLHEPRQQWATFGKEVLTTSALMATGTAFGGLYWATHALQHSTCAAQERERGHLHQ